MIRDVVIQALIAHQLDRKQSDVPLPFVRCTCGATMPSNRYRAHLADEITDALEEEPS